MNEPTNLQILSVCIVFLTVCFGIAHAARRYWRPDTADKIRADQLRTAEVGRLEWTKQAEHARAMADMYDAQAQRLSRENQHVG